jgi:hypothetical protein
MRRLLSVCAFALLVLGFAVPQAAHAQAVNCVPVNNGGGSSWPTNYTFDCTGSAQIAPDANTMYSQLESNWESNNELTQFHTSFYLFNTPANYQTYAAAHGLTYVAPGAKDFGVTFTDANNVPVYSAIFEKNSAGTVIGASTNVVVAVAYEKGKSVDYLDGYITQGGVIQPPNVTVSNFALFTANLANDFTELNKATNNPCFANGSGGLFTARLDSTGAQICSTDPGGNPGQGAALTAPYLNLNNQNVLKKAWPQYYTTGTAAGNHAFYAEEFTSFFNAGLPVGANFPFQFHFACTKYVTTYIGSKGYLPPTVDANRPVGCTAPTVAQVTYCSKVFQGTPTGAPANFPATIGFGRVLDCVTPGAAHQLGGTFDTFASRLTKLGAAGTVAPTEPLQASLISANAYVYLFANNAAYQTAFIPVAGATNVGNYASAIAGTYKYDNIWYTILLTVNFQNASGMAFTAAHELGHTFDDSRPAANPASAQPSSTAQYALAMQHDWLDLDYASYPTPALPTAPFTLRLPCVAAGPYIGPLVGVIDPSTITPQNPNGSLFCNNGLLVNPGKYGADRVSAIIRDPSVFGGNANYPPLYQAAGGAGTYAALAGWREWHSEALAIRATADVQGIPYWPLFSQVVGNGYFACTAGSANTSWAYREYTTGNAVTSGYPCQTALPAGYVQVH